MITRFQNLDDSIIEFVSEITTEVKIVKTKKTMVKLDEPILIFNYVSSQTKSGEVRFKKKDFKNYLTSGIWKKI